MKSQQYLVGKFPGWDPVRSVVADLGAGSVLRTLIAAAWRQTKSSSSGRFIGGTVHHFKNHDAACRIALRLWLDEGCPAPETLSTEAAARLAQLLLDLSDVVQRTPIYAASRAHNGDDEDVAVRRVALASWIVAIQDRCRNRMSYHEMGRLWLALRKNWEDTSSRARAEGHLPLPLKTAFESLETNLILSFSAYVGDGWIEDPRKSFSNTLLEDQIHRMISHHVPPADAVVGTWAEIEHEVEHTLGSRFATEPLVRLPGGAVLAPDPGFLLPAIEERMIRRTRDMYGQELPDLAKAGPTALGYAFETTVAAIVEECAKHSADERFVPEFILANGSASPDAHIIAPEEIVLFEAKAIRLPEPPDPEATLDRLLDLMMRAAGVRDLGRRRRGPLEQATDFILAWHQGDAKVLANLGTMPTCCIYVIVVPFDLPACIHWPEWRRQAWRPHLGAAQADLDERVVFLTPTDLEVAAVALKQAKEAGTPTTLRALLDEFLEDWRKGSPVRSATTERMVVRGGLADLLMSTRSLQPGTISVLQAATEEVFDTVILRGMYSVADVEAGLASWKATTRGP